MKKMKMYLVMLVVSMLLPMRVSAQTVKGKLCLLYTSRCV